MDDIQIINLTPGNIADYGVCGYKDVQKHKELKNKIAWFETYYPKGLRIKVLNSLKGGYQGMLEYIPGRYAHRPVNAAGYMFIHCICFNVAGRMHPGCSRRKNVGSCRCDKKRRLYGRRCDFSEKRI